ncbi:MAG: NLP/P60 family protein [uncultured Sulfurovum sp.]|uniref:NLP/P60 family protein n=1 Tax=uncultured Sulfurovum sp. TaxID=269237 RepID=A0A6S6U7V5_9BACT|nr:MAG: NLP/P60 family protein [uncultured Sulfurovum sp.]
MKKTLHLLLLSSTLLLANQQMEVSTLAKKYLGGKYVWGGEEPSGFDCSGYTQYIFNKIGINLPRTAYAQSKVGTTVKGSLKKGDLLFFNTDPSRGIPVTHVGVYLEKGKFIHAASKSKGIIISALANKYQQTYLGAKRLLQAKQTSYPSKNNITLPKEFFHAYKKALVAPMKTQLNYDLYRIYKGQYLRESQIKELQKMENNQQESNVQKQKKEIQIEEGKSVLKKVETEAQALLKEKIDKERLASIKITYSAHEAEELGAFEERALSEEDALDAIDESL